MRAAAPTRPAAALVERRLGEKVDKTLSRTNWAGRPLPQAALDYAADDVRHLAAIYPALREELEQRRRLAWLEEECARMTEADRYRPKPEQAWRGVKGLVRLAPEAQHRVARLAAWREEEAIRRNRPRRWILDDIALCQLATRQPQTVADLGGIEGVSAKLVARAGETLLALVQAPVTETAPLATDLRPTAEQRQRIQALLDALRVIAEKEQIAQTLIATRNDIEALARDGAKADIPLLRGWRRTVAGEALLSLSS
jgi:ribonuclease D